MNRISMKWQRKAIHALIRKCYLNNHEYRELLRNLYGTDSSTMLTVEQANDFIARLKAIAASIQKSNKTP